MNALPAEHPRLKQLIRFREYVDRDKPKVLRKDFAFQKPLTHGWMLPYLISLDDLSWGRWEHWSKLMFQGGIGDDPIPQIEFASYGGDKGPGRKMLERCLNAVTKYGEWQGWSSFEYFDYFMDWILFGFGHSSTKEEPKVRHGCEGASERLYQLFNLEPLLAYPYDHFGDILAENNFGRRSGFFPTPLDICRMMTKMQLGEPGDEDLRDKTVCDPCVGTGRMLLPASNYSYRLYGMDVQATCCKATLINMYLYAPWGAKPFPDSFFETKQQEPQPMKKVIPQFELPEAEQVFNLVSETAQDGARIVAEAEKRQQDREESEEKQLALF